MRLGIFEKAPVANFVVAGASRSGTTSLYHYLGSHPDIFLPDTKEQWYFNCDDVYRKGLSAYRRRFSGWNGQAMIGDITPSYFVKGWLYEKSRRKGKYYSPSDSAAKRIARTIPDAKIVLTLRHPVARLVSQYVKNFHKRNKVVSDDINKHVHSLIESDTVVSNYVYANRYSVHLEEIMSQFPSENVIVIVFEEWTDDVGTACRDIFRFMGIDDGVAMDDRRQYNSARSYVEKSQTAHPPVDSPSDGSGDNQRFALNSESKDYLLETFRPDTEYVERFLGRPIDAWRSYETSPGFGLWK